MSTILWSRRWRTTRSVERTSDAAAHLRTRWALRTVNQACYGLGSDSVNSRQLTDLGTGGATHHGFSRPV